MKLTILGGAGVRTPLFIQSILRLSRDIAIDEVSLMDPDTDKLNLIELVVREVVSRAGNPFNVKFSSNPRDAIAGADFVVSAIRVGGLPGRVIDETVPLRHGVIGQETTGPGGFCMGLRTIPVMLEYVRMIKDLAPKAWLINFTNPSGMITQAITSYGEMNRVIGVCDGPAAMFHKLATALDIDSSRAYFDYFGLNHLGWLRGIYVDGEEILTGILGRLDNSLVKQRLEGLHEVAMFGMDLLKALHMIPNEYLYYYYYNREALEHVRSAGETRGQFLVRTTEELMGRLHAARAAGDPVRAVEEYNRYIETRRRMYMRIETGTDLNEDLAPRGAGATEESDTGESGGYEHIALEIIRAIMLNLKQTMVLNTKNGGVIEGLGPDSVVELPCAADSSGVHPLAVGEVPKEALGLMQIVKEYEKLTIDASVTGSYLTAWKALTIHPLVPSAGVAREILDEYLDQHGETLAHIRRQA
ncbi:MAG: hypothetical protein M1379_12500 [Firmicutes bacterium]|nr:hypothetical protein [Bacillota bacterium]